jgi:hypothetical protein
MSEGPVVGGLEKGEPGMISEEPDCLIRELVFVQQAVGCY